MYHRGRSSLAEGLSYISPGPTSALSGTGRMEMEERGARVHVDKKSDRQGSFLNRYKRGRDKRGFVFS